MITSTPGTLTYFSKANYLRGLPNFVGQQYSLAFDAEGAERLQDYAPNVLYFRDQSFNRVATTFSRTSSATRVNKQGLIETVATGVPRIDYSDGSAKLLMEPSRTNALQRSENPNTYDWGTLQTTSNVLLSYSLNSTIGVNVISAKDNTANVQHRIIQGGINQSTFTGTRTYTLSINIKRNGIDYIRVFVDNTMNGRINLIDGTNNLSGGVGVNSVSTEMLPNGYVRFVLTYTKTNITAAGGQYIILWHSPDGSATTYAGDNTKGTLIYGFQHEIGSYPTSYIPTVGSAVTRNDEFLRLTNLNINGYIDNTYTIYLPTFKMSEVENSKYHYSTEPLTDGFGASWNGSYRGYDFNSATSVGPYTFPMAYKVNRDNLDFFWSGAKRQSFTSVSYPQLNNLNLFRTSQSDKAEYTRLIIFDGLLTDSECIQLTT